MHCVKHVMLLKIGLDFKYTVLSTENSNAIVIETALSTFIIFFILVEFGFWSNRNN